MVIPGASTQRSRPTNGDASLCFLTKRTGKTAPVDAIYDATVGTARLAASTRNPGGIARNERPMRIIIAVVATAITLHGQQPPSGGQAVEQEGNFRFRSGVELIN